MSSSEQILNSIVVIKAALNNFYNKWDRDHKGSPATRLSDLTPSMLGVGKSKVFRCKAMEAWYFTLFLVEFLPKHLSSLGPNAELILHSGRCLVSFVQKLKSFPDVMTVVHQQELMNIWVGFMRSSKAFGIDAPKTI